jgi:hypothetical protein
MISVRGGFWLVVNLKFPFSSVNVPCVVPFTETETAGTTSLLEPLRTFPEIVVGVCAKQAIDRRTAITIEATLG